jgi:predicted aspartyl protease
VTGTVDNAWRALLHITLRHPTTGADSDVDAWIDTAFTGDLTLPRPMVLALGFPLGPTVRARLADGSETELESFSCLLPWLGQLKPIEIVANDSQFPLLGVGVMRDSDLHINYRARTMTVS